MVTVIYHKLCPFIPKFGQTLYIYIYTWLFVTSVVSIEARSPPAADNHNHKLFMWSGEIVGDVVAVIIVVYWQ